MTKLLKAINITLTILSAKEYMVFGKDSEGKKFAFTDIELPKGQAELFRDMHRQLNVSDQVINKLKDDKLIRMN